MSINFYVIDGFIDFFDFLFILEVDQYGQEFRGLAQLGELDIFAQFARFDRIHSGADGVGQIQRETAVAGKHQIAFVVKCYRHIGGCNLYNQSAFFANYAQTLDFHFVCRSNRKLDIADAFAHLDYRPTHVVFDPQISLDRLTVDLDFFDGLIFFQQHTDLGRSVFAFYGKSAVIFIKFDARLTGKVVVRRLIFDTQNCRRHLAEHKHLSFVDFERHFHADAFSILLLAEKMGHHRPVGYPAGLGVGFCQLGFPEHTFIFFAVFDGVSPNVYRFGGVFDVQRFGQCRDLPDFRLGDVGIDEDPAVVELLKGHTFHIFFGIHPPVGLYIGIGDLGLTDLVSCSDKWYIRSGERTAVV